MKEQPTTALATSQRTSPLMALGERFQIEPNKLIEVLRGTVIKPTQRTLAAMREQGRLCAKKIASQTETTTKGKPQ